MSQFLGKTFTIMCTHFFFLRFLQYTFVIITWYGHNPSIISYVYIFTNCSVQKRFYILWHRFGFISVNASGNISGLVDIFHSELRWTFLTHTHLHKHFLLQKCVSVCVCWCVCRLFDLGRLLDKQGSFPWMEIHYALGVHSCLSCIGWLGSRRIKGVRSASSAAMNIYGCCAGRSALWCNCSTPRISTPQSQSPVRNDHARMRYSRGFIRYLWTLYS